MLLIFTLSSLPSTRCPPLSVVIPFLNIEIRLDRFFHLIEYAILGLLMIRAMKNRGFSAHLKHLMIISVLISAFYGLTDEIHQYFVPGRIMDMIDWLFDCIGSTLGVLYYRKT